MQRLSPVVVSSGHEDFSEPPPCPAHARPARRHRLVSSLRASARLQAVRHPRRSAAPSATSRPTATARPQHARPRCHLRASLGHRFRSATRRDLRDRLPEQPDRPRGAQARCRRDLHPDARAAAMASSSPTTSCPTVSARPGCRPTSTPSTLVHAAAIRPRQQAVVRRRRPESPSSQRRPPGCASSRPMARCTAGRMPCRPPSSTCRVRTSPPPRDPLPPGSASWEFWCRWASDSTGCTRRRSERGCSRRRCAPPRGTSSSAPTRVTLAVP